MFSLGAQKKLNPRELPRRKPDAERGKDGGPSLAAGPSRSESVPSPASADPRPGAGLGGLSAAGHGRPGLGVGRSAAEARGAEGRRPQRSRRTGRGRRPRRSRPGPPSRPPSPSAVPLPRASGGGHRMFFRAGSPHHPSPAPPLSLSLRSPPPLPPPAPCLTLSRAPRRAAAPGGPPFPPIPQEPEVRPDKGGPGLSAGLQFSGSTGWSGVKGWRGLPGPAGDKLPAPSSSARRRGPGVGTRTPGATCPSGAARWA